MGNSEYEQWEQGSTPRTYAGLSVEAVRVDAGAVGNNVDAVVAWIESKGFAATQQDGSVTFGHETVAPGEWIVHTAAGRLQKMDDALFDELHDRTPPPLAGG